jgi:hypothetical protein
LFKALKVIEIRPSVGFIAKVVYIVTSLLVILDHSRRVVRGGVVRYDNLDTALAVELLE